MADPSPPWSPGGVLAVTKFHVPERPPGLVARGDLVGLLGADRHAKLALISAPPGAGKTTLLAEWCASAGTDRAFAWLSLDPDDEDPVRFWGCVVMAIRTVQADFGERTLGALRSAHGRLLDVVVPLLVNEAAELSRDVVLVLDDLHVVGDPAVHRSLAFLVDRLPARLRLAVATRHDPPLPLARWRTRGELVEVRAPELRFTDHEAAALLLDRFGIELHAEQLTRLQARTEGWAAGLQLAALSLRRGVDVEALLESFGTGNRQVLEYLAGEVLDAQDPDARSFMLETSVLGRMSGPLCDAVTDSTDSAARLEDLDRRNLLVVPLDADRTWWRYHHLFAELLQRELGDGERVVVLHRRAARWHREHGMGAEAIRHALAAGDDAMAAQLVAEHWSSAFNRGELATVDAWLSALPPALVVADARLWLARLWIAMDRGQLVEVRTLLGRAEREAIPEVREWAPVLHGLYAFKRGDLGEARRHVGQADLETGDTFRRTTARLVRGISAHASGGDAVAEFTAAADLAADDGNGLGLAYALGHLALTAAERGDHETAAAELERLDALLGRDRAIGEHFVAFAGELARAAVAERGGAYEAAAAALERAVELTRRGAGQLEMAAALVDLGRLSWARGRRDDARTLAREARRIVAGCPDPGRVAGRLSELELRTEVRAAPPLDELSESELAVLRLLPTELSNREIGEELYVSVNTVKTHVRSIYAKLRAGSREQAVGRAREIGLL
jgi:LuxR family transcriptional regulator, maltose regulon positive regulatory protein